MQFITTSFMGYDSKGVATVRAQTVSGVKQVQEWDDILGVTTNHVEAAKALATHLKWDGDWKLAGIDKAGSHVSINALYSRDAFTIERQG